MWYFSFIHSYWQNATWSCCRYCLVPCSLHWCILAVCYTLLLQISPSYSTVHTCGPFIRSFMDIGCVKHPWRRYHLIVQQSMCDPVHTLMHIGCILYTLLFQIHPDYKTIHLQIVLFMWHSFICFKWYKNIIYSNIKIYVVVIISCFVISAVWTKRNL